MRNTRRQLADRGHLLRLQQLVLRFFQLLIRLLQCCKLAILLKVQADIAQSQTNHVQQHGSLLQFVRGKRRHSIRTIRTNSSNDAIFNF